MRALVIFCHAKRNSFTAAVRDVVLARSTAAGAETRLRDLYAERFQPVLTEAEWQGCLTRCYGLPAMLKGWLDRVLLPEVAFLMPDATSNAIRPRLQQITRLGVFTTCRAR